MFEIKTHRLDEIRGCQYTIRQSGELLSYADVLKGWQENPEFRSCFITCLADAPFTAYRWETPSLTQSSRYQPFEFVLIDAPSFTTRKPDQTPFQRYFSGAEQDHQGIVQFLNLGKDAMLIVPSPRAVDSAYGHLADFIRHAPTAQVHALWQVVGRTLETQLSDTPIWLSTAGGGVAWLHIRLDSFPKYYRFAPYKLAASPRHS